jgi:hypothetical protein
MQPHKLCPQYIIHWCDVSGMSPEGIVHGRKSNVLLLAFKRRVHHMSGVEGVHEVRGECSVLLLLVHRLIIETAGYREGLNNCRDNVFLTLRLIRLHTR